MRIKIKTPSRIHITLIDLNASIGRVDGGIGIALEDPGIVVSIKKMDEIDVENDIEGRARAAAEKVLKHLGIEAGAGIRIEESYSQHVGLGFGTQIALGVGKGVCDLYGAELGVRDIAEIVGRGGTSGIGTAAFEHGGFILDGGHRIEEKPMFLPSSASRARPPPVLARYDFPDWKIVIALPGTGGTGQSGISGMPRISGKKEVDIFQKYCPIKISDVEKLSHIILMKVMPSVVDEDIEGFGSGINDIQETGFKKIEVGLQTDLVKEVMDICREHSYGTGLSSFGPAIYSVVEDEKELVSILNEKGVRCISTRADNSGARAI